VQHLPPKEDARYAPLRASAEANWRQHNPSLVKKLEASGSLDELLDDATERAVRVLQQAEEKGLAPDQGEELANEELYLPSLENEQP
jgi:hypothetical protein